MSVGDASDAPRVQTLRRLAEVRAYDIAADRLDQRVVNVEAFGHSSFYQRTVYTSSPQSFICSGSLLMQKLGMAEDTKFGERLRELIPLAGYKNPRRFAIDGMGWLPDSGPQRLNQYLKGRIPDLETAVEMADKLNVSIAGLLGVDDLSSGDDATLRDILRHLLSLEGIPPEKADTIASASLAAQRLLQLLPDDDPLPTRAKYAARVAWTQLPNQGPDMSQAPRDR